MILLSSRPLLLEIIKLSTTWGISGKVSFPFWKTVTHYSVQKRTLTSISQGEGLIFHFFAGFYHFKLLWNGRTLGLTLFPQL